MPSIPLGATRSLVAAGLLVAAAMAVAQTAERPEVKPGDQWQFVVYYAVPATTPNRTWIIDSVTPDALVGRENGELLALTPDLNPRESPVVKQTGTEMLRFPLRVGQRWTHVGLLQFKDNGSRARVDTHVHVVAHERVRVVAGEFEAFRLEARGTIAGIGKGGSGILQGESTTTYWYAPAARAVVKVRHRNTYRGESIVELVGLRLQR